VIAIQQEELDMNIGSASQVSTLVPDSAAGKAVVAAGETQGPGQSWATTTQVESWAGAQTEPAPQASSESWATSKETENWAGDKPPAESASQKVDIRV